MVCRWAFFPAIFSSRFTADTNLIRMDAIAKTNEPSVAYKFDAGLVGLLEANLVTSDLESTSADSRSKISSAG